MKKTLVVAALLIALNIVPAFAQDRAGNNAPVEISADKTLEWRRNDKQYVADGNALVKQGDVTIKADVITADYRETPQTDFDIYRLTARGNVTIDNAGSVATGDVAVYDVAGGVATLTGRDLRMTSPDQTVTAEEKFEYHVNAGKLNAIGNAVATRGDTVLRADTIAAFLNTSDAARKLDRIDAVGRVKITTPTETLTGARGTYHAGTNKAIVAGGVQILRGPNTLNGERAEIDLTTNVSRMFGSSIEDGQTGGRVRGVFYPKSQPENAP